MKQIVRFVGIIGIGLVRMLGKIAKVAATLFVGILSFAEYRHEESVSSGTQPYWIDFDPYDRFPKGKVRNPHDPFS